MKKIKKSIIIILAATLMLFSAACNYHPNGDGVSAVYLSHETVFLRVGWTRTINVDIQPLSSAGDAELEWSLSNEAVVAISGTGTSIVVEGISEGETTITVRTKDGEHYAEATITVLGAAEYYAPPPPPSTFVQQGAYILCAEQDQVTDSLNELFRQLDGDFGISLPYMAPAVIIRGGTFALSSGMGVLFDFMPSSLLALPFSRVDNSNSYVVTTSLLNLLNPIPFFDNITITFSIEGAAMDIMIRWGEDSYISSRFIHDSDFSTKTELQPPTNLELTQSGDLIWQNSFDAEWYRIYVALPLFPAFVYVISVPSFRFSDYTTIPLSQILDTDLLAGIGFFPTGFRLAIRAENNAVDILDSTYFAFSAFSDYIVI
ncbi:MAG: Ig-like domain-containing protein [Firmicutes bacterium]|nr:Ig-like domain-containing protein [Bacillota bacterium]